MSLEIACCSRHPVTVTIRKQRAKGDAPAELAPQADRFPTGVAKVNMLPQVERPARRTGDANATPFEYIQTPDAAARFDVGILR